MSHLLIIGASDAGISAALRAREVDPALEVTVLAADEYPNYSICGLPFYVSGEVPDWQDLAHRTTEDLERTGMRLLLRHVARSIDPAARTVVAVDGEGRERRLAYDRLVVATGAESATSDIAGLDLPGVFTLRFMEEGLVLRQHIEAHGPAEVVIVGGGYIGMEMADALTRRGLAVTLIEHGASVLKTVDPDFGGVLGGELERHDVRVITGMDVQAVQAREGRLVVRGDRGFTKADMVLVATGVRPATALARAAGVATGVHGALRVDRHMATNVPHVYAAGDCVETWHRLLERPVYLPLGTTAHKQGRVAGENGAGGEGTYAGTLGTQVVKVFGIVVARTGLRDEEARAGGFDPLTVEWTAWDHKAYYPGARELRLRVTGDRGSGRLLGAQLMGLHGSEVAKRVDVFATALFHGMTVEALNDLDLSYTPPLSSPWDPVQMAAQAWQRAAREAA
jgi:NADPH-dependent 2,4-dienoyl-CoA reductase/sulfur reductase-like enzyme